jgi:Asp-tRNA(Asn)/Glu-tRNA(Gln) amidotransferase A subunit family amidase
LRATPRATVVAGRARARARAIDAARAKGEPLGPLAGVPFAAKNLFDVAGLATRAGSKINRERAPAARDATLIERLEAAGGVLVGALNMGTWANTPTTSPARTCTTAPRATRMT